MVCSFVWEERVFKMLQQPCPLNQYYCSHRKQRKPGVCLAQTFDVEMGSLCQASAINVRTCKSSPHTGIIKQLSVSGEIQLDTLKPPSTKTLFTASRLVWYAINRPGLARRQKRGCAWWEPGWTSSKGALRRCAWWPDAGDSLWTSRSPRGCLCSLEHWTCCPPRCLETMTGC